jgi:hypothetical protein
MRAGLFVLSAIAGLAFAGSAFAPLAYGASGGKSEAEVLAAVQLLLDGWKEGDAAKVEKALHPQARFVTLRRDPEELQTDTAERLVATVKGLKPGEWEDRLYDKEVRIDDTGLALVWARYVFFIHGERSHCGRVLFQLHKLGGAWKVVNFADTHSGAHCPPPTR